MTEPPDRNIRRHADGSIDIRFYALRAGALRRAAIESGGGRLLQALAAGRRLARAIMPPAASSAGGPGAAGI